MIVQLFGTENYTVLILWLRIRIVRIASRFTITTVPFVTFLVAVWTFARWLCLFCLGNHWLDVLDAAMELSLEFLQLWRVASHKALLLLRVSLIDSACWRFQSLRLAPWLRAQEVFIIGVVTGKELFKIRITRSLLYYFLGRTECWMIVVNGCSTWRFLSDRVLYWLVIMIVSCCWSRFRLIHVILKLNSTLTSLWRIVFVEFKHLFVKSDLHIFHQIPRTCRCHNFARGFPTGLSII